MSRGVALGIGAALLVLAYLLGVATGFAADVVGHAARAAIYVMGG